LPAEWFAAGRKICEANAPLQTVRVELLVSSDLTLLVLTWISPITSQVSAPPPKSEAENRATYSVS